MKDLDEMMQDLARAANDLAISMRLAAFRYQVHFVIFSTLNFESVHTTFIASPIAHTLAISGIPYENHPIGLN